LNLLEGSDMSDPYQVMTGHGPVLPIC